MSNSQENNQEQQDGRKSGETMIRPDGSYEAQEQDLETDDKQSRRSNIDRNESVGQIPEKVDSVEDDSVSKYNFLFYFLFKIKYDSEESP